MHCRYCSRDSQTTSAYCPYCGMPYEEKSLIEDNTEKTKLADLDDDNDRTIVQNPESEEQNSVVQKIQYPGADYLREKQSTSTIQITSQTESARRKWILLSVLIIVFIAGSGFGYFFWNRPAGDASGSFRMTGIEIVDPEKIEVIDMIEENLLSRTQAIERLRSEGYSDADAVSLVDSLNMNWKELALARGKNYLKWCAEHELTDYTETSLLRKLVTMNGFTRSEAQWAVAEINGSHWFERVGIPGWKEADETWHTYYPDPDEEYLWGSDDAEFPEPPYYEEDSYVPYDEPLENYGA
ncbi:hypothetical protein [Allobaculum mucilyticum]|uniref:hypothetical protein n=1 Tax=Allobaculum mucilyticum TaxID=2834459 RepID=UPI001E541F6F|nr:hypothetical protein [Allobaculum mucilyticum]UNT95583.1 hypothetical protein KWG62_09690 [Allobaculum mucilyticum]